MFDQHILIIIFGIICFICSLQPEKWQIKLKNRRKVCIILCILFIMQAGFRDYMHQINDTLNYYNLYESLKLTTFKELFKSITFVANEYEERDPGFAIFVKFTQIIFPDFRFFLVIVATIISIPLCYIIYKYSTSIPGIFLAASLYEALFESFFETGIRQTIAMGLVYISFYYYENNKKKWWIALLFIAYTIHTTSLIFSPLFFALKLKNQKRLLGLALLSSPIFITFAEPILAFIGKGTFVEAYSVNSTDNYGTPIFSALVFLAVLCTQLMSTRIQQYYPHYQLIFSAMIMSIMLTPATWVNSNFLRLTFYYLIFLMPAMSVLIDSIAINNSKMKSTLYFFLSIAFMVLSAK